MSLTLVVSNACPRCAAPGVCFNITYSPKRIDTTFRCPACKHRWTRTEHVAATRPSVDR